MTINDNFVPQPSDRGGMENKEGYNYGFLKKNPIFPEIMALVKNPVLKAWAEECNKRNRRHPVGVTKITFWRSEPDFNALRVGDKMPLPGKENMKRRLANHGYQWAVEQGQVTAEMVREISYEVASAAFYEKTGASSDAIGNQLCCAIHEDKRGYAVIVPNWAHKQWKHNGYAATMAERINADAKKPKKTKRTSPLALKFPRLALSRKWIKRIGLALMTLIVLLLLLMWYGYGKEGSATANLMQNSMPQIDSEQPVRKFDWSKAVIINVPVNQMPAIITDEQLRSVIESSVDSAISIGTDTLRIPTLQSTFDLSSSIVNDEPMALAHEIATLYKRTNHRQHIIVNGYACNIGNNKVNDYVSSRRAKAIKDALIACGIDESKIEIRSYGKRKNKEFAATDNSELRRALIAFE